MNAKSRAFDAYSIIISAQKYLETLNPKKKMMI